MTRCRFLHTLSVPLAFPVSIARCANAQTLTYLASLNGTNGQQPSFVIQATGGDFYGTTTFGGATRKKNVVRITPAGEISTVVTPAGTLNSNPQFVVTK